MASLYGFELEALGKGTRDAPVSGGKLDLAQYKGKVVLVQNVATICGTTVRDFEQMNALTEKLPSDAFGVLACPTNQFGLQTNEKDFEILNTLKYVRPGNGYEPKFPLSTKIEVNGESAHPLFVWLRATQPTPYDDVGGAGAEFIMKDIRRIIWSPVTRSDIIWNFEKFLINQRGECVRRYSPKFATIDCESDIRALIEKGPDALSS